MSLLAENPAHKLPSYALVFFALLTFGITWLVIGGYIFLPDQATAAFGELSGSHPRTSLPPGDQPSLDS